MINYDDAKDGEMFAMGSRTGKLVDPESNEERADVRVVKESDGMVSLHFMRLSLPRGRDRKVYLAVDGKINSGEYLGDLKQERDEETIEIPPTVNVIGYNTVVIFDEEEHRAVALARLF